MPARSTEAITRKNQRKRAKHNPSARGRNSDHGISPDHSCQISEKDWPQRKITKRRMMPKLPWNTSKEQLRAMLAQAAANTERM
jgi:hypothetical protein